MEQTFSTRRFVYALLAVSVVLGGGTAGYHYTLDEPWLQSFYRAVVSASLTGLDTVPRNDGARLLTIVVVLAGISIFAYLGSLVVEAIARGVVGGAWAERRRRRAIERLENHYIICGFGRVGQRVASEFRESGVPFIVVDYSEAALGAATELEVLFIKGDGTEDEDLREAGLDRARGLVAASDDDADNLYISLSARSARPDLLIVARASDEDAAKKLRLAGADRVVQPYSSAGREMAKLVLKPQVAAFLDIASTSAGPELRFEEIEVKTTCPRAGYSIRDLRVREATGAVIVALRKLDGSFDTTPEPEARLEAGDVMIAVGTPDELRKLEEMFAPVEAVAR